MSLQSNIQEEVLVSDKIKSEIKRGTENVLLSKTCNWFNKFVVFPSRRDVQR